MDTMPGGWSETKDVEINDIQKICDQVKSEVEKRTAKNYVEYRAVQYRTQVVAGFNYLVKVFCGEEDYIHLSLFQQLPCYGGEVVVRGVEEQKTKQDPLVPFPN